MLSLIIRAVQFIRVECGEQMSRFSLPLSRDEVGLVQEAVDDSLNYQDAFIMGWMQGRDKGIDTLTGSQIMHDTRNPSNVIKRVKLRLDHPYKRASKRKSGWPATRQARDKVRRRTAELRAQNIPSPFVTGRMSVDGDGYIPTPRQKAVLRKAQAQVALLVGADVDALSPPHALVSMINSGGDERRSFTGRERGIAISVRPGTAACEIESLDGGMEIPDPLDAGEGLVFDRHRAHREPRGDYRRVLTFTQT